MLWLQASNAPLVAGLRWGASSRNSAASVRPRGPEAREKRRIGSLDRLHIDSTAASADHHRVLRGGVFRRQTDWVRQQLAQGLRPEKLALSLALGAVLGLFPVLGITTLLCLALGALLRLNHPAMQLANYAVYPLQVALLLGFVRLGEYCVGAVPVPFSIAELVAAFRADPGAFVAQFGLTGLHGILGWLALAPLLVGVLHLGLLPLLRAAARRIEAPPQTLA